MNKSQMSNDQYALFFDVRRSIRYHDRRRSFFELMHRITAVLTILMAGSVLFDIGKPGSTAMWLTTISVFAALLATLDMVIGYSSKADLHRSLKVQFGKLEMSIISGGDSEAEWNSHQIKRLEIELEEPPVYRALDLLCYNEIVKADGIQDKMHRVSYLNCCTCHIFKWADVT